MYPGSLERVQGEQGFSSSCREWEHSEVKDGRIVLRRFSHAAGGRTQQCELACYVEVEICEDVSLRRLEYTSSDSPVRKERELMSRQASQF